MKTEIAALSSDPNDEKSISNFRIYACLLALCCISHFATHLEAADFDLLSWWFATTVLVAGAAVLHRPTLNRFFLLIGLQTTHALFDAPFNPDHWLLMFFVNAITWLAALSLCLRSRKFTANELFEYFAPAARIVFLICYGFAAFSKYNTHFLGPASSCARQLAEIQIAASPWMGYVTVPMLAGGLAVICESAIPLLLLAPRTRRYGILLGLVFHTILVISPAIAVFDFSVTVFTMVYLFAPKEIASRLQQKLSEFARSAPSLAELFGIVRGPIIFGAVGLMIMRSLMGFPMYGHPQISRLIWMLNLSIAGTLIATTSWLLFKPDRELDFSTSFQPRTTLQYTVICLALLNGICPYIGLKTQGSFTMFSNLKTEDGYWNHMIVPQSLRVFDQFQDKNFHVAAIDDLRVHLDYVQPHYLVPAFEIQRAAAMNRDLTVTIVDSGREITLKSGTLEPVIGSPPSWWMRKLMIFRPVTREGEPYCGN